MGTMYNWELVNEEINEKKYMMPLFNFVVSMFIEIFGYELMSIEQCIVYNDPNASCPMLILNCMPIKIRTNAKDLSYWAQFIFHLSHELTHYAIRQQKADKDITIKWFEETICEAMSMHILALAASRWHQCELSMSNSSYSLSLNNYNFDLYNNIGDSILKNCTSLEELRKIEEDCENKRIERSIERNHIFSTFMSMPTDIRIVANYTRYISIDGLTIDFTSWISQNQNNSEFIRQLAFIQPIILA